MSVARVFHIPCHLSYVSKLRGETFHPVLAPAKAPMRVADLLAAEAWDFFDVLHLHTVELATLGELRSLADRLDRKGKPLVATVHDLSPNIEGDTGVFRRKLALVLERAAAVLTLTQQAAGKLASLTGTSCSPEIVPHGQALTDAALPCGPIAEPDGGFAIFGALRTNRNLRSAVTAWQSLPVPRPPLRVLLRSVSDADRAREVPLLKSLEQATHSDRSCTVEIVPAVVPDGQLVDWLSGASVLVLPYRSITHSGQLELACDVGLPVLAPDEPTLRDQLAANRSDSHPVAWFPYTALRTTGFADHLREALELPRPEARDQLAFRSYRRAEHMRIIQTHAKVYGMSGPTPSV